MISNKILGIAVSIAAIVAVWACGGKQSDIPVEEHNDAICNEVNMPGDSTLYGLACDGCSDTLLVLLPNAGGDPDTLNILEASKAHRVFGRLRIGDKVAVIRNAEDSHVGDIVINMNELKGEWCYQVIPTLRERAGMDKDMLKKAERKPEFDSIIQKLLQPREYGVEIKGEYTARPIGIQRSSDNDKNSPVVLPPLKRYRAWRIFNGKLLLSETSRDTTGSVTLSATDTATLVLLHRDTLVLRFNDGEQGYYRKRTDEKAPQ